ncbi:hypothetical protein [Brevibacterium sp.]|uniref:hypothetical protein n=1 Tax=Brevibacterium sp. TaxID=1701 RepID=UPI0028118173|nr:hypothetical protein [Brevibacterium sp.]
MAARLGLRGGVFHDAGRGLNDAGVAGLVVLTEVGVPAAALDHRTCRIGDTSDMFERGRVSVVNDAARTLGAAEGMSTEEILTVLARSDPHDPVRLPAAESRVELFTREGADRAIVLVDSAALVEPGDDDGKIIVTGSHGGLIGGDPRKALKAIGFAAVFNDAGIGIDDAGIGRLAALDARGIPALTVDARTARIGEAFSTLGGIISRANDRARSLGAAPGETAASRVLEWAREA